MTQLCPRPVTPLRTTLLGLSLACASLAAHASATERPNVLLILLDDAGYADFGFMGSTDIDTPHIDRLAQDGIVLSDLHVTATVCAPSRAGLLTGRYQQRFGFEANIPPPGGGLPPSEVTIAEALQDEGYRTILVGKWHLGVEAAFHPLNHGFDEFWGFLEGGRSYFPSPDTDQPRNPRAISHNYTHVGFEGYLTDVLTDRAIDYIRQSRDQPFFLFLSYNAPHTPMEAKDEHLAKYAGHRRARLAAMMWSVDENIGRLRAALVDLGIADNTLIFFLSDNGGAESNQSSNRPLKGWKGNKFEGGHRVPGIVSWPAKLPQGARFQGLASSLDIFPTALAAARQADVLNARRDGINLLPQLAGSAPSDPNRQLFWRKGMMAAMRLGSQKLMRLEGFGYRFYDLADDLAESVDRQVSHPAEFRAAVSAFRAWERSLPPPGWYEVEEWASLTWDIHHELMHNRQPRFKTPWEANRAREAAK
jgi:arylsulfatase A-like enzyme